MPRLKGTWQARGEYLADCCGLTAAQFAAGIDSAMAGNRQNIAVNPASGQRTGAGTKTTRRRRTAAAAQTAGAAQ
jgi:hypothetical protein